MTWLAQEQPARVRQGAELPQDSSMFRFRLYIGGDTPNSAQALANLKALCTRHLPGQSTLELVDVFREPELALEAGVFMTPTLVRLAPGRVLRIVGTLAHEHLVLQALGIAPAPS
jgi:circadian clock protein KaiB